MSKIDKTGNIIKSCENCDGIKQSPLYPPYCWRIDRLIFELSIPTDCPLPDAEEKHNNKNKLN